MSNNFICPFCNSSFPLVWDNTYKSYKPSFLSSDIHPLETKYYTNTVKLNFYRCPTCDATSLTLEGLNGEFENISMPIHPNSLARQFPEYIPKIIREDYQEAYSILNLSPKASATLARRCLQGMIRDFWEISKSRLIDEINALQDKIPIAQWNAINSLRSIGNIGAHMEKDVNVVVDVDPHEAERLLKLIELLLEKWYIARHDEEQLLTDISNIAKDKKSLKSK